MNHSRTNVEPILVSACLMGQPVRYNASCVRNDIDAMTWLHTHFELKTFCPEVAAGMSIPRAPAEIDHGTGAEVLDGLKQVKENTGQCVTDQFVAAAHLTLAFCQQHNIRIAILTAFSPSCANSRIYDGSFSGKSTDGRGVTAELLSRNGIKVYNQNELDDLRHFVNA
ncbi:DUF523 domain-containing protein [Pseudoalteromonas xiamenensis]|uniref:DUF523 domain-containing protein n=1 Tax=Pseudoalteromonas xiamenensis TaxID=882626 RepID=A0A975HMX1_9GAMM|nr:DUF523 domain-containing protein [Pseudoalteromonas xiamenensis]QTH73553.1 DUF523 domain-containing protein [Pseudoalteromonas xiamenensis]